MDISSPERCPACESPELLLLGQFEDGEATREFVCMKCLHAWPEAAALIS